ncbi:MAG: galactose-1-phosphate uridylyltransferase [Pseudonocardia sp.]|nr:galactose-1-phosphate uridylyltransferase [Pseudonocardia sp.]
MNRTATILADGRELIYFDDVTADRTPPRDTRDLPRVEHASTARFDVLTGEWVTLAAHRMNRTFLPPAEHCPLCPTRAGHEATEIPDASYEVVVFENRFPSLARSVPGTEPYVDGTPLWRQRPANGRCEVVCFTSDHDSSFTQLPVERVRTVIDVWADRTAELSELSGIAEVFPFENRGVEIGVTLEHPHGQIYAFPFLTPRSTQLLTQARAHHEKTGRELLGDVLAAEQAAGTRVLVTGEHWTAFVPAAARWPIEAHLVPHRQVPDFAALDDAERAELAVVHLDLLRRLTAFFGQEPPYIAAWHQAPIGTGRELTRMYLQLFSLRRAPGKLKYLAGSESGAGAWIGDTTPEAIADRLREVATS